MISLIFVKAKEVLEVLRISKKEIKRGFKKCPWLNGFFP